MKEFRCLDCERHFFVGELEPQTIDDGPGLSCPWCDSWAIPYDKDKDK